TADVNRLIAYYKSPLGRISRALVREQVIGLAEDVTGRRILCVGFATPYLRFALDKAERVLAFMPACQGASAWPRECPSRTVLSDPPEVPLTAPAIDLTIAAHALEHVADAEEMMRDPSRITAPTGNVIIVVSRR